MHINSIKLTHFKNYTSEQVHFSTEVNCIVGLNGMGKTNLLDAIYYLCIGKSNFNTLDKLIIQQEKDFFRLEGAFDKEDKQYQVTVKVAPKSRKQIELNGVKHAKLADHIGLFPVVMVTPFDIELAMEGSDVRRRFLDNSLSQIDYAYLKALLKYNRILKQRNAALKSFSEGTVNHALLDSLDEQLIEPALFIYKKRKDFNQVFLPIFKECYNIIAQAQEVVNATYRSVLSEDSFEKLLKEKRSKDIILQRSTVGVHRDDLLFCINDYPLKKIASQGQLKSFILALKLAQYQIIQSQQNQITPILLLDDIFDKLDDRRVEQLIGLLFERNFGQIFFTDTQSHRLPSMLKNHSQNICQFTIENGMVKL